MKTVEILNYNKNGKKIWSELILDSSIFRTSKNINQVKQFLNYWNIQYLEVRLVAKQ